MFKYILGISIVSSALVGCGNAVSSTVDAANPDAAPQILTDPCASDGFRAPLPDGGVLCPGAPGCACPESQVCCMQSIDSRSGKCEPLGACRTIALACSGPEACGGAVSPAPPASGAGDAGDAGDTSDAHDAANAAPVSLAPVCCLDQGTGGGTFCRSNFLACPSRTILCHSDDDCISALGAPFCRPADFGTLGVSDRGLDGLVGICSRT